MRRNIFQKISIITVVLNGQSLIERTIHSVLEQTYSNVEYIIIDGASVDGTMAVVEKYRSKITKFISEKDQGIYDAMNKGILLSTGDFLYFLNAGDQFVHSNVLERVTQFCAMQTTREIIYGDIRLENMSDRWIINEKTYRGEIKNLRYLFNNMFCQQRAFFHRNFFDRMGKFDTSFKVIADYDLVFRAYQSGMRFGYLHEDIVSIALGGYSNIHLDRFLQERLRSLRHLPWWQWYWILDHVVGAISRGSIGKYIKSKRISLNQ